MFTYLLLSLNDVMTLSTFCCCCGCGLRSKRNKNHCLNFIKFLVNPNCFVRTAIFLGRLVLWSWKFRRCTPVDWTSKPLEFSRGGMEL